MTEFRADGRALPRVLVVAPGDAYDARTNSGVPLSLLTALHSRIEIVGTVSAAPSQRRARWIQLQSFAPTKRAWRSRWRLSMGQVRAAADAVRPGFAALRGTTYDAVLQLGTYCSVADLVARPVFVYIDHDLPALVELDPRMRGTSMKERYVRRRLAAERAVLNAAACTFTFSDWCRDRVIADYGIAPDRVVSVGAGSNIAESLLAREPAYDARHAILLGFDFERKGGPEVLQAFAAVRSRFPSARLTIVGGLPAGEPQPGVTSTGRLTGPASKERIADIFASGSLYVMPSRFEPFGIAFLEAMAAGLPCIGGKTCAMPEIIGDTGAIVEPRDVAALTAAMTAYLGDPAFARAQGERARARYHARYGWSRVADNMLRTLAASVEAPA